MHVDQFIEGMDSDKYASWFFALHRLPAVLKLKFEQWIKQFELYCDYEGQRYRVTGCSRHGDVWLASYLKQEKGYDKRVTVEDCSNWDSKP